ncbi:MAG: hypothetical protein RJB13_2205 [Pseudomonadota bacterium]|jgi:formimidoylglutamase
MLGLKMNRLHSAPEALWPQLLHNRDVLVGVPDDRGVGLNFGHLGSAEGPRSFRDAFYRLYDVRLASGLCMGDNWCDLGDVQLQPTIEETHSSLSHVVHFALTCGASRVHVIGGGHDFSFGSYMGHARSCSGVLPIINFDAHFDLRPVEQGNISSGTPFRRVIEELSARVCGGKALLEVGIQRERNPQSLWDFAQSCGVSVAEYTARRQPWTYFNLPHPDDCLLELQIATWLDEWLESEGSSGQLHASIDLDVFHTASALGTSASTSFGVPVESLWPCVEDTLSRKICRVVDVAELCPQRDVQSQTARLAAALVFRGALSRELSRR